VLTPSPIASGRGKWGLNTNPSLLLIEKHFVNLENGMFLQVQMHTKGWQNLKVTENV
jgi:hypothetical protein